jgi:hypothetical protein
MSPCIEPALPIVPRCPVPVMTRPSHLPSILFLVPLPGLTNRQESCIVHVPSAQARVPETISAKTVKEATKAYERKPLNLLLLRSQAPKNEC